MAAADGKGGGLRRLLQVGVTVAAVVLIARVVDPRATMRILGEARVGWVVLAVWLYVVGQIMSAFRWWLIGRSVGLGGRITDYVRYYFIGMFFMSFGPSTLGGDFVRGLYLAEGGQRRGRAFNSVVFDRLNGLVVLVAIGAAAFLIFPGYRGLAPEFTLMFWVTVAFGGALLFGWLLAPWLVRMLLPPDHRLRHFVEVDLGPFWTDRRMLLAASTVSFCFHLVQIAAQWVVSRAIGVEVPLSYIAVFHPLVSAVASIPVTFSGIGLREGGYLYFLTKLGVDQASAVAYGVLWLFVIITNSLLGGLVFLASGARLPALRADG
ncbi:MAG: flippase-like domain-containing protein [Deltaproteobacteria bacterium]|nr:flippase-like domain-containing protein [Deltaproteobacteria bacterium]